MSADQLILLIKYVAIHEIKPDLTLNKSIYVGFTVLELIKCVQKRKSNQNQPKK